MVHERGENRGAVFQTSLWTAGLIVLPGDARAGTRKSAGCKKCARHSRESGGQVDVRGAGEDTGDTPGEYQLWVERSTSIWIKFFLFLAGFPHHVRA